MKPAPKLTVVRPRRRRRVWLSLADLREAFGLVPYLSSSLYSKSVVEEINARIYVRRLLAGLAAAAILLAFAVGFANACEPRVYTDPLVTLGASVRGVPRDFVSRPSGRASAARVVLPAEIFDAYFPNRSTHGGLLELRVNGRLFFQVRASRGDPLGAE